MSNKKEHEMSKTSKQAVKIVETVAPAIERIRPAKDEKGRFKTVDMTMEEIGVHQFKTKSAQIRFLHSEGYSPSAIATFMGVIYQHVRNVLNQVPKKPVVVAEPAVTENNDGAE